MTVQYFSESDMLYIKLVEGISTESQDVGSGVVLDFDARNRVIGIELEDASRFIDLSQLEVSALPLVDIVVRERKTA